MSDVLGLLVFIWVVPWPVVLPNLAYGYFGFRWADDSPRRIAVVVALAPLIVVPAVVLAEMRLVTVLAPALGVPL